MPPDGLRLITLVPLLTLITLVPLLTLITLVPLRDTDPPTTRVSSSDWRLRMVSVVRDSFLVGFFMSLDERIPRPIFPRILGTR